SLTWLVSSYLIVVAVTQPIGGQLGDALGHLRVVRWGLVILVACSFAAAFAWSFPSLVAARSLQGITAGLISPNITAFLRKRMSPGRLGSALGSNGAAVATGAAIGPIMGGFLLAARDWRLLFLANVPLGIVALLLVLQLRSDEGAGRSTFSIDTPSVLALAGVFTGATLIGTAIQHPSPIVIAAALLLLPVSAFAYLVSYVRRGSGVVKFQLFTRRNYWVSAAGVSLSNLVQYTILIGMPLYLTSQAVAWLGARRLDALPDERRHGGHLTARREACGPDRQQAGNDGRSDVSGCRRRNARGGTGTPAAVGTGRYALRGRIRRRGSAGGPAIGGIKSVAAVHGRSGGRYALNDALRGVRGRRRSRRHAAGGQPQRDDLSRPAPGRRRLRGGKLHYYHGLTTGRAARSRAGRR
ncbi:MAG TPA: MFS transporter, partial [Dehalococcoidia bacterium]